MFSSVFREAAAISKRELVIKKDTSGIKSAEALAVERGDYDTLFSVTTLNHLVISGFSELISLSPKIGQLQQLFQLVLNDNLLTDLPSEIGSLTKLKHLDVSRNKISNLPASFYTLSNLQTVILAHNCLIDESFPPDPPSGCFTHLHHLDLVGNQLTYLPSFVYLSQGLQELLAIDNHIAVLETTIAELSSLKVADLKRNKLTVLPFELSLCSKLKSLDLVDNPISDRRLLKLVTQHGPTKPKAILDYIATHSIKPSSPEKKEKGKKSAPAAWASVESDEEIMFSDSRSRVRVVRPVEHVEVLAHSEARKVRAFLVCAIVRRVELSSGNNFKKFITLQTKLHDGVCKRRRAATIATHDLSKLSVPLFYTSHPATEIEMIPLGRTTPLSVQELLYELEASKIDKRGGGGGKKGTKKAAARKEPDPGAAALSKYLQLVDSQEMVCIRDSTGTVISLPPLTNSDSTKIEITTSDLFLEVTSSINLATCKSVMDSLVCEMCKSGVGISSDGVMYVEQVKVVEYMNKQLLVLYPSRTDLVDCPSILVERPD